MRLDQPVTLKHLLIALGVVLACYFGANLWADHVTLRELIAQLRTVEVVVK